MLRNAVCYVSLEIYEPLSEKYSEETSSSAAAFYGITVVEEAGNELQKASELIVRTMKNVTSQLCGFI